VQYSEADRALIQRERARAVIGTPETVKARLLELQQQFQADE
jgi:alkanesulfonate monooxygenase SsuD/methylene tetrahydromethanopterin reductase-like flavin-dependent oxidoreductase (luciferase family)